MSNNKKRRWSESLNQEDFCCQLLIHIPKQERDCFLEMLEIIKKVKSCIYQLGMQLQGKEFKLQHEEEKIICLPLPLGLVMIKRLEDERIITIKIMNSKSLKEEEIFTCFLQAFEVKFRDIEMRRGRYEELDFEEGE